MEIKLKIQVTVSELFDFLINHTYSSFSGYVGIILSICAIIGFGYSVNNEVMNPAYKFALLFTGLLFTVIQPVMLYFKARKQVKQNEAINKPLEYLINADGIKVSCGEESVDYSWNDVMRITSTKKSVIIYVNRFRAFVLPKRDIGEQLDTLKTLVRDRCMAASIKIR